jgi:hypothetical protein
LDVDSEELAFGSDDFYCLDVYRIGNWHREPIPWNPTKLKIDSTQNRASRPYVLG